MAQIDAHEGYFKSKKKKQSPVGQNFIYVKPALKILIKWGLEKASKATLKIV